MAKTEAITIALVGDPRNWHAGLRHPDDWERAYDERPHVTFQVNVEESLGSVLLRAVRHFRVEPFRSTSMATPHLFGVPPFIAFYRPDRPNDLGNLRHHVVLLDSAGRARWTWRWEDEPIREYLRAGQAGVLDGDPRRPYLLLQPPIGNGVLADWPTLVELLRLAFGILGLAASVEGALSLRDRLSERFRTEAARCPDVIDTHYADWLANGAVDPTMLQLLLGVRPWHPQDLADLLACTSDEAEALLLGFGHERRHDGLWVPGESQGAQLQRGNVEFIIHAGMTTRVDAVESVLRGRVEDFGRTGEAPELDWLGELSDLPSDMSRLPEHTEPAASTLRERLELVLRYRAASVLHRVRRGLGGE